jgi:hypothetical protein
MIPTQSSTDNNDNSYKMRSMLKTFLCEIFEKDLDIIYNDVLEQLNKNQSKPKYITKQMVCGHNDKPYYAKVNLVII